MRYAFKWQGCMLPVSNIFDADGIETDDPDDANFLVAGLPNGEWLACRCEPGDLKPILVQ